MRIAVIGCSYLGAVHAASMASIGHDVVGFDIDEAKIASLSKGLAPFFEPELPELLSAGVTAGNLRFTTDPAGISEADLLFIAVGTPQRAGSDAANLDYIDAAIADIITYAKDGAVVAGKSTVPVGTARAAGNRIREAGRDVVLIWNPEFLREGFAVQDTLSPDRIVYGLPEDKAEAAHAEAVLDEAYATILATGIPRIVTGLETAELVKVSANAFLATKISFINAIAEVAEVTGADVTQLADAIGIDTRIGRRFLNAGVGFGGGCLPKDIRAFSARAEELGVGDALNFLREVDQVNLRRRERVVTLAREHFAGSLEGAKVAVLGLAFKPNSDDIRDSPALDVARKLAAEGAIVYAYDPHAGEAAASRAPELNVKDSLDAAIADADLIVVVTEWDEFKTLDPSTISDKTRARSVVDGRNTLDPAAWSQAGFEYVGLGRARVAAQAF